MKIVYVGHKEIKSDNVAQSGLIWKRGEVHEIADPLKAAKLIEHKLIWQNADGKKPEEIAAMVLPEIKAVPPEPRVHFIPSESENPFWDPIVVTVPGELYVKLREKQIQAVFITPEDADLFKEWKELRGDTSPKKTGPRAQAKETKQGLDTKEGLGAKKVA